MSMGSVAENGQLAGHRFARWTVRTKSHRVWLWTDATRGRQHHCQVHPSYLLPLALTGPQSGIQDILALCGAKIEDGALAGGYELDLHAALELDTDYVVEGAIESVEAKHGRRIGSFDRLNLVFRFIDPRTSNTVAIQKTWWILPRKGE